MNRSGSNKDIWIVVFLLALSSDIVFGDDPNPDPPPPPGGGSGMGDGTGGTELNRNGAPLNDGEILLFVLSSLYLFYSIMRISQTKSLGNKTNSTLLEHHFCSRLPKRFGKSRCQRKVDWRAMVFRGGRSG